jgi:hypothetical protein
MARAEYVRLQGTHQLAAAAAGQDALSAALQDLTLRAQPLPQLISYAWPT